MGKARDTYPITSLTVVSALGNVCVVSAFVPASPGNCSSQLL
jgi:hypothetical protein